jgi:chromosome segregation ATPase
VKASTNITVEILKEIRSELRSTNASLASLREETDLRFKEVGDGLGALGKRLVESELRTATALTDLAGTVREMTSVLRAQADLRPRVESCERHIAEIERRLPAAS